MLHNTVVGHYGLERTLKRFKDLNDTESILPSILISSIMRRSVNTGDLLVGAFDLFFFARPLLLVLNCENFIKKR